MSEQNGVPAVSDASFEQDVEKADGLVVVDFWAPWCGPCRVVAPIIEQLAAEYAGRVAFRKLNIDENPDTAMRYGIRSIPTIGVFRAGTPVNGVVGAVPKAILTKVIEESLAA